MNIDTVTLISQIGSRNFLAISGGRVNRVSDDTVVLPVAHGYRVAITLDADDTYTVRRIFTRGAKSWIKWERESVYADQVGEIAYRASCYLDA